jgi:NADH:ubiquinone oxidoreductase subunit 3 (subunit A)
MGHPDLSEDRTREPQRIHLLEIPFVWFGIQLVELAIVTPLIWALVPRTWPTAVVITAWVVALAVLTALNYSIRRRFIPR